MHRQAISIYCVCVSLMSLEPYTHPLNTLKPLQTHQSIASVTHNHKRITPNTTINRRDKRLSETASDLVVGSLAWKHCLLRVVATARLADYGCQAVPVSRPQPANVSPLN